MSKSLLLVILVAAASPAMAQRSAAPLDTSEVDIRRDIRIPNRDGATLCAMVVRLRNAPPRLPALLRFTIYADPPADLRDALRTASHKYVSVTGYARGKLCSPGRAWPYVHDADDAATIIEWVARQPWSDGRVGMYGGSYEGFTQWAAAKRMPSALKAIMTGAAVGPGIDVPMEGNIVWNFLYPWPLYTTDNKTLDAATYGDAARWRRLNRLWYVSGRAYRDLDQIDGAPNLVWDEWLAHPAYDAYWQRMIPFRSEFARIHIPVLQTAGYFYGGPGAALYYFTQHYAHDSGAEHYLLIGPYDHFGAQRGVVTAAGDTNAVIAGYTVDPVARIDIVDDLRYQWFDYVLKHGPRPALLENRVNYEVVDANVWKHAPSIAAMSNGTVRFHLSSTPSSLAGAYRLSAGTRAPRDTALTLRVDLADRSDLDRNAPGGAVLDVAVDTAHALEFVSDPIPAPMELSGLVAGDLDIVTNKRDFDFSVSLFELLPNGKYLQIPPFQSRASFVRDSRVRRLLRPGKHEHLPFRSTRLASVALQPRSRLVLVVAVIKNPGQQINYGAGKDVNSETVRDAGAPLTIRWFPDSFIEIPVHR